jgi:hypothetical protein
MSENVLYAGRVYTGKQVPAGRFSPRHFLPKGVHMPGVGYLIRNFAPEKGTPLLSTAKPTLDHELCDEVVIGGENPGERG